MSEPVAVEIGPRNVPLIRELKSDLFPPGGSKVVYVEKEGSWLESLAGNIEKDEKIIRGDASKLSLAPNSVSLSFLKDVIGHQGQPEFRKGGFTGKLAKTGGISNIASELSRVTKEGGRIVILETATPYDKNEIIEKFAQGGLKVVKDLDRNHIPEIFEDENMGRAMALAGDERSYALVLEKSKSQ